MTADLRPAGDLALLVEFEEEVSDEMSARVRALDHLIETRRIAGVVETVPSFRSLLVYYDPLAIGYGALRDALAALVPEALTVRLPPSRHVELPCCYDDATLGFELEAAAARLALTPEETVRLHTGGRYPVYFLGFAPGQPYMGGTPERLRLPRLDTPRTHTPAGSVGIGGTQCCVYTVESPGGFWVLGRTPVRLYDPAAETPILLAAGDVVTFRAIDRDEYDRIAAAVTDGSYQPVIA